MLTDRELRRVVDVALTEDAPWGDITTQATITEDQQGTAVFVARERGVMSCEEVLAAVFESQVEVHKHNGDSFEIGDTLATVGGSLAGILTGERVALNLLQRACGIATLTRAFVDAIAGTNARIADTRKTAPGLRALDKQAVLDGGGHNHRYSLSDAVLIKDNHIAAWRARGLDVADGLKEIRGRIPHTTSVEIEVDDLQTLDEVLSVDVADTVLLDNFSIDDTRVAVDRIARRCLVEVSGGVNLQTVRAIADAGADIISIGALTHSVRAIDIGLDIRNQ